MKNLSTNCVLVLFSVFFFSPLNFVFASLLIDEISPSPSSKEWVEVYNDTDSSVDITKYKILDAGANVNGHSISALSGQTNFIDPHSYAVIAKVPEDFGVTAFKVFKSSLGIKTTGDTIILRDTTGASGDNIINLPNNAVNDGDSYQLIDNLWQNTLPTPGSLNKISFSSSGANTVNPPATGSLVSDTNNQNLNTNNSSVIKNKTNINTIAPKIRTEIVSKDFGFVEMPISFDALAYGTGGEQMHFGKYFWNFGDGDSAYTETSDSKILMHTYFYPGDYTVSLDYYSNNYSDKVDASDQMLIRIIPFDVSISNLGNEKDFFVELTNNSIYDIDLSGYRLASDQKSFTIPRNTVLSAKKKIIISSKITSFSVLDKDTLKLISPDGQIVFTYGPQVIVSARQGLAETPVVRQGLTTAITKVPLVANAISTDVIPENTNTNTDTDTQTSDNKVIFPISAVFVGISAYAVYFIRQKRSSKNDSSSGFEIDE